MVLVVKNLPANAGDVRNMGLIPGTGRSLRGGHGNPLQYSSLEDPMGRGAWWATVHRVAESDTNEATSHIHTHIHTHTPSKSRVTNLMIFPLQLMSHSNSAVYFVISCKLPSPNLFNLVSMKVIIIFLLQSYFVDLHNI